jgi:hypothetical protein
MNRAIHIEPGDVPLEGPYLVGGVDVGADGVRVNLFRPRVMFSTPPREEPPCEG